MPYINYYIFDLKSGQKNTSYTSSIRIKQGLQMHYQMHIIKNLCFACFCLGKRPSLIHFKLGSSKLLSALGDCSLQPICPLKQKPTALQGTTPLKTNMTGWKISIFNKKCIFIHGGFSTIILVLGRVTYPTWGKENHPLKRARTW